MTFHSILFRSNENVLSKEAIDTPAFFADLNLDQIIGAVTAGKEEYNLNPIFFTSLQDIDTIRYRQDIFRDLENETLMAGIKSFAQKMSTLRRYLSLGEKISDRYNKEGWFLATISIYCEAVNSLIHDLDHADLTSPGFAAFREYIVNYAASARFKTLVSETNKVEAALAAARYCLLIEDSSINVRRYEGETDYNDGVEETFARFKQGAAKDYRVKISDSSYMNHVEEKILTLVAKLYPDEFANLSNYCTQNGNYLDETIVLFDREIQCYLAYMDYIAPLKQGGLKFCYPSISSESKEVCNYEGFDLALAHKLVAEKLPLVCNDFSMWGKERIFVVSGPNQGGKTTFARTFGQLHYLAALGCPVPGREARLFLFDRLFTHFEEEENINNLRGKLQDDLVRIHNILKQATTNSIIIMNEIFTSTTLKDAIFLGKQVMGKIMHLDLPCICVTFIDELTSLSEKTVSMVSTVAPDDPARRTYKIVRKSADGLSYAISLAEKHRLTYDCLKERLKS